MADVKPAAVLLFISLLAFPFSGCLVPLQSSVQQPAPAFSPDLPPSQYAPTIEKLEATIRNADSLDRQPRTHLYLAWLYASYKNPTCDYRKALEHTEQYLTSCDASEDRYAAENLRSMLTVIATLRQQMTERDHLQGQVKRLQNESDQLTETNRTLRHKNDALEANNRELASYNKSLLDKNKEFEETIERLKTLEMQLELKRKSFR